MGVNYNVFIRKGVNETKKIKNPCFKGRDVCDGLIFLSDVIDLTQTKKQDACVFLFIDFHKAFACVDHIFLRKVLKRSGFSDIFCNRIFALF